MEAPSGMQVANRSPFVVSYQPDPGKETVITPVQTQVPPPKLLSEPVPTLIWVRAGIEVLGLIVIFGLLWQYTAKPEVDFFAKNLAGPVPLATIFHFEVKGLLYPQKLTLDAGNGFVYSSSKESNTTTYSYQVPGLYHARLLANQRVLAEQKVYVNTNGWESSMILDTHPRFPAWHQPVDSTKGRMYVSPQELKAEGHDIGQRFDLVFSNIRDFGVDGDNFTLEAQLMNNKEEGGINCYDAAVEVIGESYKIRTHFLYPGALCG